VYDFRAIIVYVVFEFERVKPDSKKADRIIEEITEACETMSIAFDANNCWVDDCKGDD
jgi:hypothetical protein